MRIQSLKGLHIQRIQLFRTVERQRAEPVQVMAHNAVVHVLPLSSEARIVSLRPYSGFRRRRGIPPVACATVPPPDRKRVVQGKNVSVRVVLGVRSTIKNKIKTTI